MPFLGRPYGEEGGKAFRMHYFPDSGCLEDRKLSVIFGSIS